MRCHSQALTIKLTRDVPLDEIEATSSAAPTIGSASSRTTRNVDARRLTPAAVPGTLHVAVGRLRKLRSGRTTTSAAFTVGDQLLWGAAEPLRRMLRILAE